MEGASAPRQKSFEDYLHDVAGESHELDDEDEEELQRLNVERSASEDNKSATSLSSLRKPRAMPLSGMVSPQLTEARSFVNGLLSPFSPLLELPAERHEFLEFVSLQPCRKVSVVVRVLPCEEDGQRCLFPHVTSSNPSIHTRKSPHDMVVVKPSAFGKVIPSSVTMETARLVAQVAHISSEDWARLYEFHHVMWPAQDQGQPMHSQDQFSTMDSLSRAVVQDALGERQSSLLISLGQAPTCVGDTYDQLNCQLSKIIAHCRRLMEPKSVATVSIVELKEGKNAFRDLLDKENKQVSIRHVDMKGALLEGLSQISIDEIHNHWPTTQSSTVVATISVWDNAVSHQMNRGPDSQITCVELAISVESNAKAQNKSCTVSLGSALRQLLRQSSQSADPVIAFRESPITEVLQRSLESSKIVVLASVSQLSQDYETTLSTLNFLRSLLVKQGKTASSPFTKQPLENGTETEDTATMTDMLQEYVTDETILQQITADPRQRLAKIMKPSPSKQHPVDIETVPSTEDDYNPIDYMRGLDAEEPSWYSPAPGSRDQAEQPTFPIRNDEKQDMPVASLPTNHIDWSMEDPIEHPVAYPSFSESSQEDTDSPVSQRLMSHAEETSFDHDFEGSVDDHGDVVSHEDEGLPFEGQELYSYDHADGPYAYPDSEDSSPQNDIYDDDQKYEEMFGSSSDLKNQERLSIQLLDDSSHGSDGVLSLAQHEYDQDEDDERCVELDNRASSTDVSHEIVFELENEDNDSLLHTYDQPQMWSDSQDFEDDDDDNAPVRDRSVDESLTSHEPRSSVPSAGGIITSEHENKYDNSTLHNSRQDSQSRQRSAFEAIPSFGNAQSSLQGSERSSRANAFNGHYNIENSNGGKIHLLEGAVEQMQSMQSALWRSR
jgi:Kinesin motor domain